MMAFAIDRGSGVTYPLQVNRQAVAQLVAGRLQPGARLPSVREFSRLLGISRTTSERIHNMLCDTLLVQARPRSGIYLAETILSGCEAPERHARETYALIKEAVRRTRKLGVDQRRLIQLIRELYDESGAPTTVPVAPLPLLATREWYECLVHGLRGALSACLVHLVPSTQPAQVPSGTRFLLADYFTYERGRRLAGAVGCGLLFVRYNVALLDRAMTIPAATRRYFVMRDQDNADSSRVFLANAYPEVDLGSYSVMTAQQWLARPPRLGEADLVFTTVSAEALLQGRIPPRQLRLLHPLLADDFVDQLRRVTFLG